MRAKVIKNEAEHQSALNRLEAIFDEPPGTPEGDEAELLGLLIDLYEDEHFPIGLPSARKGISNKCKLDNRL